jgi:hypothetical protein
MRKMLDLNKKKCAKWLISLRKLQAQLQEVYCFVDELADFINL